MDVSTSISILATSLMKWRKKILKLFSYLVGFFTLLLVLFFIEKYFLCEIETWLTICRFGDWEKLNKVQEMKQDLLVRYIVKCVAGSMLWHVLNSFYFVAIRSVYNWAKALSCRFGPWAAACFRLCGRRGIGFD
jgi:ABC-type multidrug transport system permease subunit